MQGRCISFASSGRIKNNALASQELVEEGLELIHFFYKFKMIIISYKFKE